MKRWMRKLWRSRICGGRRVEVMADFVFWKAYNWGMVAHASGDPQFLARLERAYGQYKRLQRLACGKNPWRKS